MKFIRILHYYAPAIAPGIVPGIAPAIAPLKYCFNLSFAPAIAVPYLLLPPIAPAIAKITQSY